MEEADIVIYGCSVLPMDGRDVIEDGAIAVKDGRITFVGRRASVTGMRAEVKINAKGKVAMPGLINCHTHVPMALFRGLAEDLPLSVWLKDVIWPLELKLKPEDIYVGALLGCLEMVKSGTTCFADMYFNEDSVAKAVDESGLRGVLAEGIIEAGDRELGETMLKRGVGFAERFRERGRVVAMLGPHATYSCSPELLTKVMEEALRLGVRVHIHLAESKDMSDEVMKKHGCSEVEFLERVGFLNGRVLAAHCVNISDVDGRILSKHDVNAVHVPISNMKLGLGVANVKGLIDLGVNVALGTDGPASSNSLDMFETMKVAALLQKLTHLNPRVLPAHEVLKMATVNGARALGLEKHIGSLEVGKIADIILVNFSKPHLKPAHNICANLVYSARGCDVDTVIVDGRIVMEDRTVKTLDEQAVMMKAEKTALDLLSRKTFI